MPVVRVDGRPVGDGRPGPVTREIARRFAALVEREAETF
jgi:branched-chain amino acid aminotransferase